MAELELSLDIRKMLQQMEKLERAFRKQFPSALDEAEDAIEDFEDQMQKSMKGATASTKQLLNGLTKVEKKTKETERSMRGMSDSMRGVSRGFSTLTTAAIGFAAAFSVKEFVMFGATYERQIGVLKAVTRGSTEEMLLLRKAIRETGASTEFTATQAAQAAANLAAMGMPAKEVAGSLKLMVASAQALQSPIEEVSRIIKSQQNIFRISTKEIADTLTGAYTTSAANLQKLDVSLRILGGSAKQAGLSFQETVGALAFMIDRGQSAERAGTALRSVMAQLSKPTKEARLQMEKLGLSFDEIKDGGFEGKLKAVAKAMQQVESATERERIAMNLFNLESAGAAATLIEGFMEGKMVISEMADQVGEATTAMEAADKITNDILSSVRNLGSALQDRVLEVFQTMEPVIRRVLDDITAAVRSISDEDIYSALETIGVTLLQAAEGFYNLIQGAVNGVASLLNSPQVRSLIGTAKSLITVVAGPDLSTQIAETEGRVNELYGKIKIAETERDATEKAGGFGKVYQDLNDMLGPDMISIYREELQELEKELVRLQAISGKGDIVPDLNSFVDTGSLSGILKNSINEMRANRAKQKGMNVQDASTITPGAANIQYGSASGLELTPEDRKASKKGKKASEDDSSIKSSHGLDVPKKVAALLPSMEAFNKLTKENQKLLIETMSKTLELTEAENFLVAQQADAQALIQKSLGIQAEQFAKPALMEAQLVENVERLNEIYESSSNNLEIFNGLQGERVRLESQFNAAVSQGSSEQARKLDAQLKAIEALLSGTQAVMLTDAKAAIQQEKRLQFSESLVGFAERANEIGQSNQHYEQGYTDLKKLSVDLAAFQTSQEAEMTAEKRAQINSMFQLLRMEEEALRLKEEQAKISLSEQVGGKLAGSFGVIGAAATNTQGFKDLGAGVMDQGTAYSFDPKSLAGGPQAAALDAILQVVTKTELFQAQIDASLGTLIRLIDAIFSPLTNATKELTKSFQPVIDVIGELSQVIFDAFTPLKPFVALARGVFKVLAQGIKSLVVALKPLTHAMQQVTNIINNIFGGTGGSFGREIEDLSGALQSVRDAMQDLKFSDMNPADSITKLKDATEEYDELRKKAFGDGATQEDIEKFADFANTYLGLSKDVNKSSSQYAQDFEKVSKDLEGLEGKLVNTMEGTEEDVLGLGNLTKFLEELLEKVAEGIVMAVKKLLEGAFNLIQFIYDKVVEILTDAFDGTVNFLGKLIEIVGGVLERAFEGTINLFTYLVNVVRTTLQRGFQGTVDFLTTFAGVIIQKISEGFEGYLNFLEAFYTIIWEKIKEGFEGYLNFLEAFYGAVWEKLKEGFEGYINFLTDFYGLVWDVLVKAFEGSINFLSDLTKLVGEIISKAFEGTVSFFDLVVTEIKNLLNNGFTGTVNFLQNVINSVVGVLQRGFTGYVDFISIVAQQVAKAIETGFQGSLSFATTLFNKISEFITKGFSGTFDFVGLVVSKISGMLSGTTNLIQTIIDKIMKALGFSGQRGSIPILPNPFYTLFKAGPKNFLSIDYSFGGGGEVPSFAQGGSPTSGYAVGPSHQSGMLGMTKGGSPFLFEGKEFIINKKTTELFGSSFLQSLNQTTTKGGRKNFFQSLGMLTQNECPDCIKSLTSFGYGGPVLPFNVGQEQYRKTLLDISNPFHPLGAGPSSFLAEVGANLRGNRFGVSTNIYGGNWRTLGSYANGGMTPYGFRGYSPSFSVGEQFFGNTLDFPLLSIPNPARQAANWLYQCGNGGLVNFANGGMLNPAMLLPGSAPRGQRVPEFFDLGDLWDNVTNPFQEAWGSITEGLGGILEGAGFNNLNEFFNDLVNGGVNLVDDVLQGGKECMDDPIKCLEHIGEQALNLATDACRAVGDAIRAAVGPNPLMMKLNMGILDFWNSRIGINTGGSIAEMLGIGNIENPKQLGTGGSKRGNPKFKYGGMVGGLSHALGGTLAELEKGEFVINKRAAQSYGYGNLASINNGTAGSDAILQKISQTLENLSRPNIEVHVYTDMRGEAKAEISKYRYEVKQKAERIRQNPTEKLIPLSAI